MGRILLGIAALISLVMAGFHVFAGGPVVVDPIFATAELADNVKWLSYFTWHDGTVVLLVCGATFAYVAMKMTYVPAAVLAGLMLAGMGCLGLGLAIFGSDVVWTTPAPFPFLPTGLLGLLGARLVTR